MANNSIMELINKGGVLRVYDGMTYVWPQYGNAEEIISCAQELCSKFNGAYSPNNSTVAFISGSEMYVAPYTRELMSALSCFRREYFYVPFSNLDYPKFEQNQWESLRAVAREASKADFVTDCEKYCDEHHIGSISDETLANCFEIPEEGVRVKHLYFEDTYYPIMNQSCLDCRCENLGHFCYNNGCVVFVYRNGKTYVAKGYKIIQELESVGFTNAGLFVPFSNGEQIQDWAMRNRWDSITK